MIVGEASVRINADIRNLARSVEERLQRLDRVGQDVGRQVGQSIREGINRGFADGAADITSAMRDEGGEAGKAFGEAFADEAAWGISALPNRVSGVDIGRTIAMDANQGFASNLNFAQAINAQASQVSGSGQTQGRNWAQGFNAGAQGGLVPPRIPPGNYGGSGRVAGGDFGRGFTAAFDGWMASRGQGPFENLIRGLLDNAIQLATIGNVIYGIVGAVSSLVSAFFALGSQIVATIPAALSLGNVLAAVVQGGIVMSSLFGGVGEGISALTRAQQAQTGAVRGTQVATEQAAAVVRRSALDELERLLRIREARDALNDAILNQARSRQDAAERVRDAEEALSDAIREEERAQRAIGQARDAARERLEDLRLELDRASLTEERAALNLAKAEKALADARAGGNLNAIYEADLAYREQAQSLAEIQERNADLADEEREAAAAGINGSQDVIDAREAHRDAVEAVSDAERELQRAIQDQPRAAVDAALQVARAQLALRRALEQTQNTIAAPVGGAGLPTALNNLATAYDNLSPAARRFVEYWVNTVRPVLQDIKEAGQEVFFPKLIEAIDILLNSQFDEIIKQMFIDTSEVLGNFAIDLANAFTTPRSLEALGNIFESNVSILESLGEAAANYVEPLLIVFESMAPVAEEFAGALLTASENFATFIANKDRAGEIVPFFETARDRAVQLWETLKSMGRALRLVFENALPAGDSFMAQLQVMFDRWTALNDTVEGNTAMRDTFQGAVDNAVSLLSLLAEISGALFRVGADSNIGDIADAFKGIVGPLEELAATGLDQIADDIIRIIEALPSFAAFFTETGVLQAFFGIVSTVFEVIADILDAISSTSVGRGLLNAIGVIVGSLAALQLFSGVAGGLVQKFTRGRDSAKQFFSAAREGAKGAGRAINTAFQSLRTFVSSLVRNRRSFNPLSVAGTETKAKRQDIQLNYQIADAKRDLEVEEARLYKAGQEIGADFSRGIEAGIRARLAQVGEAGDDIANALINNTKQKLEQSSPSLVAKRIGEGFGEGLELGLEGAEGEVAAAGREIAQALETAVDTGLEGAGTQAANEVGREMSNALEVAEPQVRRAGTELGNAMESGLDTAVAGAGRQAATRTSESLQTGLTAEVPEVRRAGRRLGEAMESGLDAAVAGAGTQAAETVSESMQIGLTAEGPELRRKGRWMATQVKAGVASAGPAVVPVSAVGSAGAGAAGAAGAVGSAGATTGRLGRFGAIASKALGPVKFLGTALKFLGKGFLALLGPIGAIIGVVWTVWEVMQMLGISFDDVKDFFANFGENMSKIGEKIGEVAGQVTEKLKEWAGQLGEKIGEAAGNMWDWIVEKASGIVGALGIWFTGTFVPWLIGLPAQILGLQIDIWGWIFTTLLDVAAQVLAWFVETFLPWLGSLPATIAELVVGFWSWIFDTLLVAYESVVGWFTGTFWPWATSLVQTMVNAAGNIWNFLVDKLKVGIEAVKAWWTDTFIPWIKGRPAQFIENMGTIWNFLKTKLVSVFTSITTWWSETFVPWVKGIPEKVTEWVSGTWNSLYSGLTGQLTKIKSWVTDDFKPWVEGLPAKVATWLEGLWDALPNGIQDAFISVVKWINKNLLPVLRKLPFVKNLPDIEVPGRADGGPVGGPNVGSKADNLLYRLTSGEYVLNRKMVRQAGGFGELERWRRGQGGKGLKNPSGLPGWLSGWGAMGSGAVANLALKQLESAAGSAGWAISGLFTWIKEQIVDNIADWIERLRPAPRAATGATLGPYRGPANGWTYPLSVRYPSYTFAGHNPWHAYDIGSPVGIGVRAVSSGRVVTSADLGGSSYGQFLRVVHADGTSSLYAHLSRRNVSVGQIVKTGQLIGVSGATGGVTGPHLHFELGADDARRMMAKRGVRLAEGGVVRATSGGVAALLAEGGRSERVTPLDSQGRSPAEVEMLRIMERMAAKSQGDTFVIKVYPSPGMDERLLAQRVSREIAQQKRRRS